MSHLNTLTTDHSQGSFSQFLRCFFLRSSSVGQCLLGMVASPPPLVLNHLLLFFTIFHILLPLFTVFHNFHNFSALTIFLTISKKVTVFSHFNLTLFSKIFNKFQSFSHFSIIVHYFSTVFFTLFQCCPLPSTIIFFTASHFVNILIQFLPFSTVLHWNYYPKTPRISVSPIIGDFSKQLYSYI